MISKYFASPRGRTCFNGLQLDIGNGCRAATTSTLGIAGLLPLAEPLVNCVDNGQHIGEADLHAVPDDTAGFDDAVGY